MFVWFPFGEAGEDPQTTPPEGQPGHGDYPSHQPFVSRQKASQAHEHAVKEAGSNASKRYWSEPNPNVYWNGITR